MKEIVPDIFEREAIQQGWYISKKYAMIVDRGALKGIKIYQTVLAPEDCIYVHPIIMSEILNNITSIEDGLIHVEGPEEQEREK
jgi:hypothetical protein